MPPAPNPPPMLRLVNPTPGAASADRRAIAATRVGAPNRDSAGPRADDPRWVLAARAAVSLEGGRAAILSPQRRQSLMVLARRMGLRPFDAALVIAIIQDAARHGRHAPGPPGLTPDVASLLSLIRPADRGSEGRAAALSLAASLVLAAVVFLIAVSWLGA